MKLRLLRLLFAPFFAAIWLLGWALAVAGEQKETSRKFLEEPSDG